MADANPTITAQALSLAQANAVAGGGGRPTPSAIALAMTQASATARGTANAKPAVTALTMFMRSPLVLTLGIPGPYTPADGGIARAGAPLLTWSPITGATSYDVEVSTDPTFVTGVTRFNVPIAEAQHGYEFGSVYYWRVRANGLGGVSQFSAVRAFSVPPFSPAPDLIHDSEGRGRVLEQFKVYA